MKSLWSPKEGFPGTGLSHESPYREAMDETVDVSSPFNLPIPPFSLHDKP